MVKSLIHDLDTLTGLERAMYERLPEPTRRQAWATTPTPPAWRDEEPTLVRERPQPLPQHPWRAAPEDDDPTDAILMMLQDPAVGVAAATAVLSFVLAVGSGAIGFVLGMIVG